LQTICSDGRCRRAQPISQGVKIAYVRRHQLQALDLRQHALIGHPIRACLPVIGMHPMCNERAKPVVMSVVVESGRRADMAMTVQICSGPSVVR
jgi:hypothetical protein